MRAERSGPESTNAEFSLRMQGVSPLNSSLFSNSVATAINQIESVLGTDHLVSQHLHQHPPMAMDRKNGYRSVAHPVPFSEVREDTVLLRPDLVQHPALLLGILTHEAQRTIDPRAREAKVASERLSELNLGNPGYAPLACLVARLNYESEINATRVELRVLEEVNPSRQLLKVQRDYFESEREALVAYRTRNEVTVQTRAMVIELAESLFALGATLTEASCALVKPETVAKVTKSIVRVSQVPEILNDDWNCTLRGYLEATNGLLEKLTLYSEPNLLVRACGDHVQKIVQWIPLALSNLESNQEAASRFRAPPQRLQ